MPGYVIEHRNTIFYSIQEMSLEQEVYTYAQLKKPRNLVFLNHRNGKGMKHPGNQEW